MPRPASVTSIRRILAALAFLTLVHGSGLPVGADDATAPVEPGPAEKATKIRELIAGKLDPNVDPHDLFSIKLDSSSTDNATSSELLRLLQEFDKPKRSRLKSKVPPGDAQAAAARALLSARIAFFSLSPAKRTQLLARHQDKRSTSETTAPRLSEASLQEEADKLEALLSGSTEAPVERSSLLAVDLLDDPDLVTDKARRRAFLERAAELRKQHAAGQSELDSEALKQERERLDRLRARLVALPPSEREALFAAQQAAIADDPKNIAADKAKALAASQKADTETERVIAEERARLLAIKEELVRYETQLAQQSDSLVETTEQALRWSRRVREMTTASSRQGDADSTYDELVDDLVTARAKVRQSIDTLFAPEHLAPFDDIRRGSVLPQGLKNSSIRDLVQELEQYSRRLDILERDSAWESAKVHRDAMVSMNRDRLMLMSLISPQKRKALKGFGTIGLQQVRRELEQITLEARYHLLTLPRFVEAQQAALKGSPLSVLGTIVQILFIIVLFRWWRQNADDVLERTRRAWRFRRPETLLSRTVATTLWYLKRVRKPLEWLALVVVLDRTVAKLSNLPELELVWLVVLWLLIGTFIIRLVNAVAQRRGGYGDSSKLRFRSLRLVGMTVVVLGLVLTLTERTVGKGAIYSWVQSSGALILVPILALLIVWWRPIVIDRAKAVSESGRVLQWVASHDSGFWSFPAAAIGGVALLLDGFRRFLLSQASQVGFTRKIVSYFFRRQLEQQTSIDPKAIQQTTVSPDVYAQLDPEADSNFCLDAVASNEITRLRNFVRTDNNSVIAVVGLRGMGKSTLLDRVAAGLPEEACWRVECRPGGFETLLQQLAVTAGLSPDATREDLADCVAKRAPTLVCIDDVQRLIRPVIGGLRDIDEFVSLAHSWAPTTSWLVGVGMPAWQYLGLAKGDRVVFDQVVALEQWDEDDIGKLIQGRTKEASITPSFKGLDIPRQVDVDGRINEEERTRNDFYRILWDHSAGNPGFALHLWRESLYQESSSEEVKVRLFKVPSANDLDDLKPAAHFVLRSILQLDIAREADIVESTGLSPAVVDDALRMGRGRGYVEADGEGLRITLSWYRAVLQLLRRHHLLTI